MLQWKGYGLEIYTYVGKYVMYVGKARHYHVLAYAVFSTPSAKEENYSS